MTKQRWFTTALALVLMVSAFLLACDQEPAAEEARSERPMPRVVVAEVSEAVANREVRLAGVTRAERRARLSFPVGERLVERRVGVGASFREGEVLARIDDRQLVNAATAAQATLTELEVRLAQVERDRQRSSRLVEAKAATSEELEQVDAAARAVEAARDAARVRLAEARRRVSDAVLRAPFDGTVAAVMMEPGEYASPGQPVLEVSGTGTVELSVEIPETLLRHLSPGAAVQVDLPLLERRVSGAVKSLASSGSGAGRLFPAVITLEPAPGLLAGLTAELVVDARDDAALSVPVAAVVDPGGGRPAVFRLADSGRVQRLEVQVDSLSGDRVMVSGDLAAGDRVVVAGHGGLSDGDAVEVAR